MLYYRCKEEQHNTLQQRKEVITMKIYTENSLSNFEFWSGAVDRVKYLTDDELDTIEAILEDIYPDGMDETQINDLFWFEEDWIAEMLGYEDFEAIMYRDDEEEDEE